MGTGGLGAEPRGSFENKSRSVYGRLIELFLQYFKSVFDLGKKILVFFAFCPFLFDYPAWSF